MEKEIKFRALRLDNNCFAFGYLEYNHRYNTSFIHTTIGVIDDRFVVNSETVEQFTGLQDKNGVDIYEGDILEYIADVYHDIKLITQVIWNNDFATFALEDDKVFDWVRYNGIKVIGNIHENKELLK